MLSNQAASGTPKVGIIGGTGFSEGLAELSGSDGIDQTVETPHGPVKLRILPLGAGEVVFVPRHGFGHAVPPHRINHHAHIDALVKAGVSHVLSTSAVGSLKTRQRAGDLIILSDFIDLRGGPPTTFFDGQGGAVRHTDFTEPFCRELRALLIDEAGQITKDAPASPAVHDKGIYLCLSGPRYETPAEVRLFASWGSDVVGMTIAPEAVLAREMGLCYATVAVVTNLAAGLSGQLLSHQEVEAQMAATRPFVIRLLHRTALRLIEPRPS